LESKRFSFSDSMPASKDRMICSADGQIDNAVAGFLLTNEYVLLDSVGILYLPESVALGADPEPADREVGDGYGLRSLLLGSIIGCVWEASSTMLIAVSLLRCPRPWNERVIFARSLEPSVRALL
jgi:hypothetical protein